MDKAGEKTAVKASKVQDVGGEDGTSLVEIGPRFVMTPMRIFDGSFGGSTLYEQAGVLTPNEVRRAAKAEVASRYRERAAAAEARREREPERQLPADPMADVFA